VMLGLEFCGFNRVMQCLFTVCVRHLRMACSFFVIAVQSALILQDHVGQLRSSVPSESACGSAYGFLHRNCPVVCARSDARVSDEIVLSLAELLVVDAHVGSHRAARTMEFNLEEVAGSFLCHGAIAHVLPA
jgi:hypothetical protein